MKKFLHNLNCTVSVTKNNYITVIALFAVLLVNNNVFAQNGIIGSGFTNGFGVGDIVGFDAGVGTSRIKILNAKGTGNQYFRLVRNWAGDLTQYGPNSCVDTDWTNPGVIYGMSVCNTTGAFFINCPNTTDNYVFKTPNSVSTVDLLYFKVEGAVQSVAAVASSVVLPGVNTTITATMSGTVSAGQGVYMRYSTDNFTTSTVVTLSGSGTSFAGVIPASVNTAGATVRYYLFTSGINGVAANGLNADTFTINLNNNAGGNYLYTVSSNPVTVVSAGGTGAPSASYGSLALAINAINSGTTHTGTTTCYINAGYAETAPSGGFAITATGIISAPITFIKSGAGANPVFMASNAHTIGNINDAIFKIIGGDYITIDGLTIQANPANTITAPATNNMTEFGVALLQGSVTNGCQNNTIQNCVISLNRIYSNTFGIYSNARHTATSVTSLSEITNITGAHTGNKVYSTAISNVNYGIIFVGSGSTTTGLQDSGNDIGGVSLATGNTITNWGGQFAASGYISLTGNNYCIYSLNQFNDNISFNNIVSAALTSGFQSNGSTALTVGGVLKNYSITQPTGTIATNINSNIIQIENNPTVIGGTILGINNQGLTPLLSTATININNNTVQNFVLGGSTSTTNGITCISNSSVSGIMNITGNNIINNVITATTATSGALTGIINAGAGGIVNINSNIVRGFASTGTSSQIAGIVNSGAVVTSLNINSNQFGNATSGFFSTSAATTGSLFGISNSGGAATCALSIQTNDIRGITYNVLASAAQTYIVNTANNPVTFAISNNTFTNLNVNTTGSVTFLGHSGTFAATSVSNINSNSIVTAYNKAGAGGTVTIRTSASSTPAGAIVNFQNNNFSNMTFTGAITFVGYFDNDGGAPTKSITGNTFNNNNYGSGTVSQILGAAFNGNNTTISNNTITNQTSVGSITCINLGGSGTSTFNTVAGNIITGISSTGAGGAVTAIQSSSAATAANINGNIINNLSSTSTTATVVGITSSTTANIFSNTINTLSNVASTSGATNGIMVTAGTTVNVFKNKIYDLSATGAFTTTTGVNGIVFSGSSSAATFTASNNLIGDLKATTAASADAIRGIAVTATGTTSTYNLYYNTVYLTGTSGGANFGTSSIFHAASATATTATLNLRNNIIVNNSTATGTGTITCFRRSAAALGNYAPTSNNNFLSSTSGSIMNDGATAFTIATFKTAVSPGRDAASVTEAVSNTAGSFFQSFTGANAGFLHLVNGLSTQAESGAVNISGITDDYDGDFRQGNAGYVGTGTAPDMGADEFAGIISDLTGPAITYTSNPSGNIFCVSTVTATITDASGINNTAGTKPRLYFKKSGEGTTFGNYPGDNTSVFNGWKYVETSSTSSPYTFTFNTSLLNSALAAGDIITYFVTAQDVLANVSTATAAVTGGTQTSVNFANTLSATATNNFTFVAQPTAITTVSNVASICISGTATLSLTATPALAGVTYQWLESTDGITFVNATGTSTNATFTTPTLNSTMYYRANVFCNGTALTASPSSIATVTVNNPSVTSTTPATRCGTGTVTLAATASAGATLNWYAASTGGASLGSGPSFITPTINTTTPYFVEASITNAAVNTATVGNNLGTSISTTGSPYRTGSTLNNEIRNQYLILASELTAAGYNPGNITALGFNVTTGSPTGTMGTFTIGMANTSVAALSATYQTTALTSVFSVASYAPVSGINTHTFSTPFSWDGSNVLINVCGIITATGSGVALVTSTTPGNVIMTTGNTATNGCTLTTGTSLTNQRPQFIITGLLNTVCASLRTSVTATVTPAPAITLTGGGTPICAGNSTALIVSSGNAGYTYTWSPAAGLSATTGTTVNASPASTTTYTVTATDGGTSCVNTASVTVTVNPIPTGVTATATPATLCEGSVINLTSGYTATSIAKVGMEGYAPIRTTGTTYTSIIPGTNVTAWRATVPTNTDDNLSTDQPIGFNFKYNGTVYSTFRVSTNGFVTFDNASSATGGGLGAYGYSNSWPVTSGGLMVAPNWDDLQTAGNLGTVSDLNNSINYSTNGTAGSRILTVEWKNMQDFATASDASYNYQVKLYEVDNRLEFVYGTMTVSTAAPSISYSLGLSAATVSATPTAAQLLSQTTQNTGSFGFTNQNSLSTIPATNTTIAFTPPATPVYSWTGPNGFTSTVANPVIASATTAASGIYNLVISNSSTGCQSAQASTANVTVNPNLPSSVGIAITSGAQTICAGSSVTFTATPTNGGTTPAYQWRLNGVNVSGATVATFSSTTLANSNSVTVVMTSNATCATGSPATSNAIIMTVNPNLPASVSIVASPSGAICAGSSVTFTASPTNGGTTPAYQWQVNGVNAGTNSSTFTSSTLANGDSVAVVLTSNASPCSTGSPATSNAIVMTVNPIVVASVSIAITSGSQTSCAGSSVTFTATPTNGGTTPAYQWRINGTNVAGATAATFTSTTLANGNSVTVVMTTSNACATGSPATSNTITMTISAAPNAGTLSGTQTICSNGTTTFTSNGDAGGTFTSGTPSVATADASTGAITPLTAGASLITYTVTGTGGCVNATATRTVTVGAISTYSAGAWDVSPTAGRAIVFDDNYNVAANLSGCSCTVNPSKVVTIPSGYSMTLLNGITVDPSATMTFANNAPFIQINGVPNIGNVNVYRNSSALMRLDYTLWSSPVAAQNLLAFSPSTFQNRFYTYNTTFSGNGSTNGAYSPIAPSTNNFSAGRGYLIRMPDNHPTSATVWNGAFTGVPNNGTQTVTLAFNGGTYKFNSIGNPYPSPISLGAFMTANSSVIESTAYFWRRSNDVTLTNNSGYVSWNAGTYTATAASNYNGAAGNIGVFDAVQTGQGFLVAASSAGNVVFNNTMRVADTANQFFKSNNERHTFWLNLTNDTNGFAQMAAGYRTNATNGVDTFDGRNFNDGQMAISSYIDNNHYVIQGKALPFDASDVIPLSYKTAADGNYTIAIDHVDGLFTNGAQTIYVRDNVLNTVTNLNTGTYTFATIAGTFNNRFDIVYQPSLSTTPNVFNENSVIVYKNNGDIVVNTGAALMKSVQIYDMRGRLLLDKTNVNAAEVRLNIGATNQVVLVKTTLEEGQVVTKKVIN